MRFTTSDIDGGTSTHCQCGKVLNSFEAPQVTGKTDQ